MITDRIVVGVRDSKLSEKMQLGPDLTLAKAAKMVRESENVKRQQAVVRTEQDGNINLIRAKRDSHVRLREKFLKNLCARDVEIHHISNKSIKLSQQCVTSVL